MSKKIHLIACGGTALTLLGIKPSTKDVDLIIPKENEYNYLIKILQDLGYKGITGSGWKRKGEDFIFDLFRGKRVHTTELMNSPLEKGNHIFIKEFGHIYLGTLSCYDIIITKLLRGTGVDIEDCMALIKSRKDKIKINTLKRLFLETASFDVSEEKAKKNLDWFLKIVDEEKIYGK